MPRLLALSLILAVMLAPWPALAQRPQVVINGTLNQTATNVLPGGQVTFEARAVAERVSGVLPTTVDIPLRYTWTVSGGAVESRSAANLTPNRLVWRAPITSGQFAVTVRAESADRSTTATPWQVTGVVRVNIAPTPTPGEQAITVRVEPGFLPADGRSTAQVTAIVPGRQAAGQQVRFTTSRGSITPQATTDQQGVARATLRAPTQGGLAVVTAVSGSLVGQARVDFGERSRRGGIPYPVPAPAGQVLLSANPPSLPADGASMAQVGILVLDTLGRPLSLQPVWLSSSGGNITGYVVTGPRGQAAALLRAAASPGPVTVTAVTNVGVGQLSVAMNRVLVDLSADPAEAPADGKTVVRLTARVTDTAGVPVANNTLVTFSSATGRGSQVPTVGGLATAQVVAPEEPERTAITATALGESDRITLTFTAREAAHGPSLRIAANPSVAPADGRSTSTITVLAMDADDHPLAGRQIKLSTTAGSLAEMVTTDDAGRAVATLTAPDKPAEALVTATLDNAVAALTVRFDEE